MVRLAALALAVAGCTNYITDGFSSNDFSGDPFPFGVETSSGAIVVGMQPVGDMLRPAVLDMLSPVTLIDHGSSAQPTIQYPDIVLDGTRGPDGPLDLPRARIASHQLLTLHPCADPGCFVGPETLPRDIAGVVGMDAFASDALRLDLGHDRVFVLPDIAGSEVERAYACDAVLPLAFRGGGTLLVGGTEVGFSNWRVVMPACGAFDADNPDPGAFESTRGADLLFVASTGIGPSILAESAYERYRLSDPTVPVYDPTITATYYLTSGPITGFPSYLSKLAIVGNSASAPRSPCHQVYANHLLAAQDCATPTDPDKCPCTAFPDSPTFCPAPAIVEITPATNLPILVVDDTDPTLQALRAELRPNQPEVDGILGTSAFTGIELDVDYPHQRLLARCLDGDHCAVRPELFGDAAERTQVQGCLGDHAVKRALAVVLLLAASANADDYTPPDFMSAEPPLPVALDPSTAWRLDLAEALRIALHQNLGIVLEREQVAIAHLGTTVAGGTFEPQVAGSYAHTSSDLPPASAQAGMAGSILMFTDDTWRLSLSQKLQTGMKLEADFYTDRSRSSAGTAVEPNLPVYNSSIMLQVSQPILRGFSSDLVIPKIDILRAELASERERQALAITAANVVEQTEDAYWDVVQALYQYDLQVRSQKRAVDQLELTKRQITAGLMPPSDVIAAESTLAQRDLALVQGELVIEGAWDRLRAQMNLPRDQWARPILPAERPAFAPDHTSAEDALQVALKNRPELAQLAIDLKSEELNVRKADNDKLPEIDLALSAGLAGQDATWTGAARVIGRGDAPTYMIGLNLIWYPLRRATSAAAEIERAKQKIAVANRDKAVQDMWFAVRDSVRGLSGAERLVYAAAKSRELATKNLELEQRRFLASQSSQLAVAQRQEELASAQVAELSAVLAHKKATAALLRATGRLLEERHVELELKK